jgi:hypothetical protein
MYGTIGWLVLAAMCGFIELRARRSAGHTATMSRFVEIVASRRAGRLVLALAWVFVGVHLFTRYTLPGHG